MWAKTIHATNYSDSQNSVGDVGQVYCPMVVHYDLQMTKNACKH